MTRTSEAPRVEFSLYEADWLIIMWLSPAKSPYRAPEIWGLSRFSHAVTDGDIMVL